MMKEFAVGLVDDCDEAKELRRRRAQLTTFLKLSDEMTHDIHSQLPMLSEPQRAALARLRGAHARSVIGRIAALDPQSRRDLLTLSSMRATRVRIAGMGYLWQDIDEQRI